MMVRLRADNLFSKYLNLNCSSNNRCLKYLEIVFIFQQNFRSSVLSVIFFSIVSHVLTAMQVYMSGDKKNTKLNMQQQVIGSISHSFINKSNAIPNFLARQTCPDTFK